MCSAAAKDQRLGAGDSPCDEPPGEHPECKTELDVQANRRENRYPSPLLTALSTPPGVSVGGIMFFRFFPPGLLTRLL